MIINCNDSTTVSNGTITVPHGPRYGQRFSYTMFVTPTPADNGAAYMVDCIVSNDIGFVVDSFSRTFGEPRRPFTRGEAKTAARKLAKRNLI